MLVTDFSDLPLGDGGPCEGKWKTLTARSLAAYLATDRFERLRMTVDDATKQNDRALRLDEVLAVDQDTRVQEVWKRSGGKPKSLPLIVTRKGVDGPLAVGIVTAFDLL